jgi:hypothetical protein
MNGNRSILAITISTYNRSEILSENLFKMLPEIIKYKIPIYISDDSTNNETQEAINILQSRYEHIYYHKNKTQLGHDQNFISALALPESEYVWYLGDSMIFEDGALGSILAAITAGPDFIFINSHDRRAQFPSGTVPNVTDFLILMAWHLTLTGATTYSRKFIDWIKTNSQFTNKYPNFIQLGLIFEYLATKPGSAYWIGNAIVDSHKMKTSYWRYRAVEVFAFDWVHAIEAAPLFSREQKSNIIKSHSCNTGLFSIKNLFSIRADGAFSLPIYRKYRIEIKKAFCIPAWLAFWVGIVPQRLAAIAVGFGKTLRSFASHRQR